MNKPTMRIAIVGCGDIANHHAGAIRQLANAEITACMDLYRESAERYATKFGIPEVYTDLEAMTQQAKFDLLLICTWPNLHLEQIRTACMNGVKAILCEKPLATSGAEALEILQIAHKHQALVLEGFMFRHHPQIIHAKEKLGNGEIGDLLYINSMFTFTVNDTANWRKRKEFGGGSLMDQVGYMVNSSNYMVGDVPIYVANHSLYHEESGVDHAHTGTLIYPNECSTQFHTDQSGSWKDRMFLHGSKGTIRIPNAYLTINETRYTKTNENPGFYSMMNSFALQLEHVYRVIFEGETPRIPLQESVQNLHVIDALREAGLTGQRVAVKKI
jgi:predicted dehydrogenase